MQAKLLHHLIGFPVRSTDGVFGFVERVAPETLIVVIDATEQTKRTNPIAAYGGYGRKLTEITHYHLDAFLSKAPQQISDVELEAKIAQSATLQQIALLRVVQYHGLNSFYQSLQQQLLDKGSISYKQMRAVLRDLLREYRSIKTQDHADALELTERTGDSNIMQEHYSAYAASPSTAAYGEGETAVTSQATQSADHSRDGVILTDLEKLRIKQGTATLQSIIADRIAEEQRNSSPSTPSANTPAPFVIDLAAIPMQQEADTTEISTETQPDTRQLPNGFYTVVYNDAGEYRTFKITDADWAKDKPIGTQAVYYLSGPDNSSDYTFYCFLIGKEFKPKHALRNAYDLSFALIKLLAPDAFMLAGKTYALRANKCFICAKKLSTPISIAAGIGPDCAANIGVDQKALAALNISEQSRLQQTRTERAAAQADVDELFPD